MGKIANSKTPAASFSLVGRPDTSARRSDLLLRPLLRDLVEQPVIRHHQVRLLAHADPPLDRDTASLQAFVLFHEAERVEHHTVAQQTPLPRMEDPRWNLVQNEFIVSDVDRVTSVGPPLVTGHQVHVLSEDIDDLTLPFIAPLATQYHCAVA